MLQGAWPGGSGVFVRSRKACAFWLVFAVAPILSLVLLAHYSRQGLAQEYRTLAGLIALLGVQAFLAEAIGLRADAEGFSFPRRLLPHLGFPTLWRRRIPSKHISRADSLDLRTARIYLTSAERVDILFPDILSKRHFLSFIGEELARQSRRRQIKGRGIKKNAPPLHPRSGRSVAAGGAVTPYNFRR